MYILDTYKRNFVRWSNKFIERHLEEPSYVGFHVKFKYNEIFEALFDDMVPGGLLYIDSFFSDEDWLNPDAEALRHTLKSSSKNSALHYLETLEKKGIYPAYSKSDLLRGFIKELMYIENKTPWFFQSISGLDTAYAINREGFRNPNGLITIDTLEAIDRRISFLINAYRSIAWDFKANAWILPENLRKFQMDVLVVEAIPIHTKSSLYKDSIESWNGAAKFLENNFPGAYNTITNLKKRYDLISGVLQDVASGNISDAVAGFFVLDYFSDITVHVFQLGDCEFELVGPEAKTGYNDISNASSYEQIKNTLPIAFRRVNLVSSYSLLEYIFGENNGLLANSKEKNWQEKYDTYQLFYNKNREKLANDYVVKKAGDIAKAIVAGNFKPAGKIESYENAIKNFKLR